MMAMENGDDGEDPKREYLLSRFLVIGDVFKLVVGCIKRKTLCLLCPSFSHTGSVILPSY